MLLWTSVYKLLWGKFCRTSFCVFTSLGYIPGVDDFILYHSPLLIKRAFLLSLKQAKLACTSGPLQELLPLSGRLFPQIFYWFTLFQLDLSLNITTSVKPSPTILSIILCPLLYFLYIDYHTLIRYLFVCLFVASLALLEWRLHESRTLSILTLVIPGCKNNAWYVVSTCQTLVITTCYLTAESESRHPYYLHVTNEEMQSERS